MQHSTVSTNTLFKPFKTNLVHCSDVNTHLWELSFPCKKCKYTSLPGDKRVVRMVVLLQHVAHYLAAAVFFYIILHWQKFRWVQLFRWKHFFFFFKAELPAFVLLLRQQSSLIQINKGAAFVHAGLMLVWTLLIALPGLIQWEPVIDFTNTHYEQRWRELEVTGTWPDTVATQTRLIASVEVYGRMSAFYLFFGKNLCFPSLQYEIIWCCFWWGEQMGICQL